MVKIHYRDAEFQYKKSQHGNKRNDTFHTHTSEISDYILRQRMETFFLYNI